LKYRGRENNRILRTITAVTIAAAMACLATPASASAAEPGAPAGFVDTPNATPEQHGIGTANVTAADVAASATVSRSEVLRRARSWVDVNVKYTQYNHYSNQYGDYRMDCSGFISMAWGLQPSGMAAATTRTLQNYGTWLNSLDDLLPGDAINDYNSHVVLFVSWADAGHTIANVYEQTSYGGPAGPDPGAIASQYSRAKLTNNGYRPLRYNGIGSGSESGRDFTGDGHADLITIDPGNNLIRFNGDGAGHVNWGGGAWNGAHWAGYRELVTGDFNGDGRADVIGIDPGNNLIFFPGDGAGNVSWGGGAWNGAHWAGYRELTAGDFNGDGRTDIVGIDPGNSLIFFPGDGAGHVNWGGGAWNGAHWAGYRELVAGDFNNDGRTDIVGIDPGNNLIRFNGDGAGHVNWGGGAWNGAHWAGYRELVASDFNNDGRTDIVGIDPGNNLIFFPGDGAGNVNWGGGAWNGAHWAGYRELA